MNAGLVRHWGKYEMRVDADFSAMAVPPAGHTNNGSAEIYAGQTLDWLSAPLKSVRLLINQIRDGSSGVDTLAYSVSVLGVYSDTATSLTFAATTYARIVFTDLKLWWGGLDWTVSWASFDVYFDSSLHYSGGAGQASNIVWSAKTAVPLFGIQPTLTAYLVAEAPNSPSPGAGGTVTGEVIATRGWRFQLPGSSTWQTPPVTTNCLAPGTVGGCGAGAFPYVVPTATNTWDGHVEAMVEQVFDGSGNLVTSEGYGGEITLVDNCPASVELLGGDYAAVLYRGGNPKTEHRQWATCTSGGGSSSSDVYTEEHPLMAELLYEATDPSDPVFEQFTYDLVAPYQAAGFVVNHGTGASHTGEVRFPYRVTLPSTSLAYYRSTNETANYLNFWGARHQHLLYWFPNDEGAGVQWPVNGVEPSTIEYWLLLAKQWRNHPSLSGGGAQTLVHIPWAPLLKGISATGIHIKLRIFANAATSFVGLHNFESQTPTIPASIQLDSDSEDAWSLDDCTAVFGANIVLSRTGSVTEYSLTFDAGKFGVEPYLYPHIAESVTVDWVLTNVSNIDVYIVDSLGKETLVTSGPPPVTHAFSSSQDEYYAGSWAQDHGGIAVSNFGVDQEPTGQSVAHMASPDFVQTFQMFTGRGAHKLKFVVTPTNPAVSVTLKYPTYTYCDNPDPVFVAENSAQTAILWPDGPGARWGQWDWFYSGDVQDTPIVRSSTARSSALDCLVTRRVLFEGVAGTNGLDAEIGTLFDADEGTTREDVAGDTLAFWIPA